MPSERARVDLAPNAISVALAARAKAGRRHLDLTRTNPTAAGLPYERDALLAALSTPGALAYEPEPFGLPGARRAVAELWASRGVPVDPEHVVLTASTSEAYSFLWKLLADPGDAVLVPEPSYPLFEHLARYEGVRTVPYPLGYDGAWYLDVDRLRAAITADVRAIVVVSPNNPTGSFVKRTELDALASLGLPIVSDEVFGAYPLEGCAGRPASALEAHGALVFALDGLSKLAALPQMKLAWITATGPEPALGDALSRLELIADTYLSPGAPVQHALPALLRASQPTRDAILRRIRKNHAALGERLSGTAATLLHAEGGWSAVVRLPDVRSEEAWVLGLLETKDVLVQPGFFYDFPEEPFVVLSLLVAEDELTLGLERLREYVVESAG